MIEADVLLRGQGTDKQEMVPIMAHPPDVQSDLTFSEWLNIGSTSGKGLKVDFKSIEAVELCLQSLATLKSTVSLCCQHLYSLEHLSLT